MKALQGASLHVVLILMMYGIAKVCFGVADIIRAVKGEPTVGLKKDPK